MATPLEPKSCSRPDDELALTMPESPLVAGAGDLELRLLQALSEYAGHAIVCTYATVKHSSRILGFVAASTETAVTKAGLVAIVRFFYNQYMALGHPLVRYVDDAVGRRVVATFVQILLAVEYQQKAGPHGALTANGEPLELTFYERLQALLYGQVPRLQTLIMDLQARGKDIESRPPAPTFNPEDYVPKEEFQRLRQEMFKSLAEKEQEVAELKGRADTAESARDQLEQDMKRAEESRSAESLKLLIEKEHEIALLKKQVAAAERAREEFARALRTAQAKHESERDKVLEEMEAEVATLKQQADAAERASEQLTANLREALTIKDEETRQALAGKEQEVEALKSEIQAAQVAHTKLQEELETTRVRMEAEHKKRVKELEDELIRAKHIAAAKNHEHGGSLREQRASFNATFVKDYVNQSKPEQVEPPKSPARSWGLRSPVRSPARSGNNQIDHDELTRKSTSSARSSSSSAASPRMSEEDKKKEKIERDKLNARVRRVLGSRF